MTSVHQDEPATTRATGLARLDETARRRLAAERSAVPTALTAGAGHTPTYVNPAFVQAFGAARTAVAEVDLPVLMGGGPALRVTLDGVFAGATSVSVPLAGPGSPLLLVSPILDARATVVGLVIQVVGELPVRPVPGRTPTQERALVAINERLLIASIREAELAESARQRADELQALLAAMTEGVTVFAANAEVMLTNQRGCDLLGLPSIEADLADYRACALRGADGAPLDFDRDILAGLLAGPVDERALTVASTAGERRVLYSGGVVRAATGAVTLAIMVYRDVTALRALEDARHRYLALLSHDLRGPLSVASMSAELMMLQAPGLPAIAALGAKVVRQLRQADTMIRELLDTQMMQAGESLRLHLAPCNLVDVARSVISDLAVIHGERVRLVGMARLRGVFGENEIRRALWNLVTNALKYGAPTTPVTIDLGADDDAVRIRVHNEGPPIPLAARDRLFEPYERGPVTSAQPPGWGLGLAVVKACAEAHGGRVLLESDAARGTTFTIELPATAVT